MVRHVVEVAVVPRRAGVAQYGGVATSGTYQPIPKPSPLVVSTPRRECRLWSIRLCRVSNRTLLRKMGVPE